MHGYSEIIPPERPENKFLFRFNICVIKIESNLIKIEMFIHIHTVPDYIN